VKRGLLLFSLLSCGAACHGAGGHDGPTSATQVAPSQAAARIQLVESEPVETSLDRPDVPNAADQWPEMIDAATRTVDFGEFYASEAEPQWKNESRLTASIDAILRAVARGVRVRFLADAKFGKQYPETLDRLARAGVAVRRIDVEARSGGVLHAKYFVVDGVESYIGSQNFDWRSLSEIQELGVRVRSPEIAGALLDIFDTDWNLAGGAPSNQRVRHHATVSGSVVAAGGERLSLVASPEGWLPDEAEWELPRIIAMLDGARRQIDVQVLTYKPQYRSGQPFTTLDEALRRATARGVHVRMIVSEWGAKGEARRAVESLAKAGVEVRVITIPKASAGDIPFARVAHAKYLVVDGGGGLDAWVGTSNWEGDYFTRSRNVAIIAEGGRLPTRAARFFEENWTSPYVAPLTPLAPPAPAAPPGPPGSTPTPADAGPPGPSAPPSSSGPARP
jgi:phosphatidylserine/phosphatidylglycerophosphate/cardiolipin synthase-like enzyme